jgi:LmbE family N-acetylglucosaminyl deacetylase
MKDENRRVLAVGAHPDDVEFMCAGTLKLLKDGGYDIAIGVIANGDCGSSSESQDGITRIRRREAIEAAKMLEAVLIPLGELDLRIEFDDRTRMKVTELVRQVDPLVVFTHAHEDYMADHEAASRLVRAACFNASVPNYLTNSALPCHRTARIPYLYYWSPIEGKNIYGDFVEQRIHVDVGGVIDFKSRMLACHRSQRDWLMKQHGMDKYVETMRETAKAYGRKCGFDFAEGFTQHLGNAYPQDNILKKILGGLVREGASVR